MPANATRYYNSAGSFSITFPPDASVAVEGIGGGGAGAYRNATGNGGGGSGGGYAKLNAFTPTANSSYTIVVGAGGNTSNNANGTNTTFNSTSLIAKGGVTAGRNNATGQATATSQTGDVLHDSASGASGAASLGGGGASSGGNAANGRGGQAQVGGGNGTDSGNLPAGAGAGGNGASTSNSNGTVGVFPGGAGGGATRTAGNHLGGNGASGQVILSYTTSYPIIMQTQSASFSDSSGETIAFTFPTTGTNIGLVLTVVGYDFDETLHPVTATWNGVTMDIIDTMDGGADASICRTFFLAAPATGTHNVVVTFVGSMDNWSYELYALDNVAQATPTNTAKSNSLGASSPFTLNIVTLTAKSLVVGVQDIGTNSAYTSGQTSLNDYFTGYHRHGFIWIPTASSYDWNETSDALGAGVILLAEIPAFVAGGRVPRMGFVNHANPGIA